MSVSHSEAARRREFGAFLRSRRMRLTPDAVGLNGGFRRRTPGLRREEVAQLAGVGMTWYTWLEQGRDVRASTEVLRALADALRLDRAERQYLFELAGRRAADIALALKPEVAQPLQRMLHALTDQPAYILGRRWDVLCWNRAAEVVFGDYSKLVGDERNSVYMLFGNPDHRRLLVDWRDLAPIALGMFRAENAAHAGDPEYERLVGTLMDRSPDFRHFWQRYEVSPYTPINKRIHHPTAGRMAFEYNSFTADDQSGAKLVVYTPLGDDYTQEKVKELLQLTTVQELASPCKAASFDGGRDKT
jgi:transcriptional regulator with XRE-family HTH domain